MDDIISVIVPVYQVVDYLPQCVDSIIGQTYKNLDIILVDDGSTDGSGELCDKYAEKDNRVRVIHKENGGLVSARKAAMRVAKGNLIANVDSDDWIDLDMFEIMLKCMWENHADVVVTGHTDNLPDIVYDWKNAIPSGVYRGAVLREKLFSKMLYNPETYRWSLSPACWDKLFRREIVEEHQMKVNEKISDGEDHAFTYPAILDAKCVCILDNMPYHHRIRMNSISQAFDQKAFESIGCLFEGLREAYQKSGYWDILEHQFAYQMRWFLLKHMRLELGTDEYEDAEAIRPYIFPFSEVKKGSRINLYGAGGVGQVFYRQIKNTGFCSLVGWVSKDWECHKGLVEEPAVISRRSYDCIVLAVLRKDVAKEISDELQGKGISEEKIIWRDPKLKR